MYKRQEDDRANDDAGASSQGHAMSREEGQRTKRVRIDRETEVEVTVEGGAEEAHKEGGTEDTWERARGEKMKKPPKAPSMEEWRLHRATHCPYRSWCPKCVAARAHQGGHMTSEDPLDGTPMVSMDYCFIRRGTDGEVSVPVLVASVRKLLSLIHI